VLAVGALTGCGSSNDKGGGSATTGAGGKAPDNVTFRLPQDYDSLDFQVDQRLNVFAVSQPAYDRLISINKEGNGYVPYIAKSWKVSPTEITFDVRTDATCEDGHKLTTEDMAASFARYLTVPKRSGSVETTSLGVGLGPGPWKITAEGPTTLKVTTETPFSNMLSLFAQEGIVCPAGLAAVKADEHALEDKTYGSGPYSMVSAAHGTGVKYKLRPEWNWGPPGTTTKTMPKAVEWKLVEDLTSAANQLTAGELDIATMDGPDVDRLLKDPSLQHLTVINYLPQILAYNMRKDRPFALSAPGGDALREAISTSVDPAAWNKAALNGHGKAVTSAFVNEAECFETGTSALFPKPDIEKAKQILTAGGFTYSGDKLMRDGKQVKLGLVTTPLMAAGPEYLADNVRKLGIDVKLENLVGAPYGTRVLDGDFDFTVMRGNRTDPVPGVGISAVSGGVNSPATGEGDPNYDRLVSEGNSQLGDARCKAFGEVQKLTLEKHYFLPLIQANVEVFVRKGFKVPTATPEATYPVYWVTGT
jgi:peptide/nickel transport system substrate-binding protein